jgi:hypothetical protein
MALYHKWDVKNDFAYVLQFFSLISDGLGSVKSILGIPGNFPCFFSWFLKLAQARNFGEKRH